ncbi:hypothetical protein Glove_172g23 [Diversispora epigaea]|uniref:Integrase catalytic domain-containing protein n=1 Tax=Diversispora epigaea TaxID=1348612 RepID=A0A397IP68_9GLOM|nr:hypothetical protein Glove_172g23 [Diversispora epigaea]
MKVFGTNNLRKYYVYVGVIKDLVELWPSVTIINGQPRHPQSQGLVERANEILEQKLVSELLKNGICNEEEIPDTIDIQSDSITNLDEDIDDQVPVTSMFTNTSTPTNTSTSTNTSMPILNEDMDDQIPVTSAPTNTSTNIFTFILDKDMDDQIPVTSAPTNTYILDKDIDNQISVISTPTNTSTPISESEELPHLKPLNQELLHQQNNNCIGSLNNQNINFLKQLISTETMDQDLNQFNIERHEILRNTVRKNLEQYTKKMANQMLKKRKLTDLEIGDLVRIKIPKIDRFGIDHSSLPCKIIEKTDNQRYQLGCKYGIINVSYYIGELEALGTTTYPELDEIPSNQISVREAARLQSVRPVSCSICNCKGPCNSNRCKCKKEKAKCTSRCHSGQSCSNKN